MSEINKYRKALLCYYLSYIPGFSFLLDTDYGFCLFFSKTNIYLELPKLYKQKPDNNYEFGVYWFKPGKLAPRIECLKKAIKLCKDEVNK